MKKLISALVFLLFLFTGFAASAFLSNENKEKTDLIENHFYSLNTKNWQGWLNFYLPEKAAELSEFINNEKNQTNHIGIFNVTHANILKIKRIDVPANYLLQTESFNSEDVNAFLIEVDYSTHLDTKYYESGIHNTVIILVRQNNRWYKYDELPFDAFETTVPEGA